MGSDSSFSEENAFTSRLILVLLEKPLDIHRLYTGSIATVACSFHKLQPSAVQSIPLSKWAKIPYQKSSHARSYK